MRWPRLDYAADRRVVETLHAYLQVVGKLPTRTLPWLNHGWHVALQVVPRGFRTYPVPVGEHQAELLVDCMGSRVVLESSSGFADELTLSGQTVADFHRALGELLQRGGVEVSLAGGPNEVDPAVPFAQDRRERIWDAGTVRRLHAAFSTANRVFERFRTGFVGKSSPSHLFWGSLDLAVTRFSGRKAPLHPGGIPNLPDAVTREAYSHEVASFGFWLGGGGMEEAAFYAYGYPVPTGLPHARLQPEAARWHDGLREFVLPYARVRDAVDPDATLLQFLESSYAAIAELAGWDRRALEVPTGRVGAPRELPSEL
ncbi:DUF5996 family protein [Porphyrobacter sp. GA68]|uniref:DUF5996 family protein n=1 Tax=Porphyrobacter sp. GA68 TaxID=2883480 RepID=UPI001D17F1D3|nr:DUF5996 family protein [Porphyrobacter sp. GA68]